MVVLRIKELALDNPAEHIATDWQVSRTMAFNDIVLESIEDHSNVTYIKWNDVLDPNVKYYARARALLAGKGYTIWGNLDIYQTEKVNDLTFTAELPSKVSIPVLTTSSDKTAHASVLFTLSVSGYTVVGDAAHIKTSWFIEDLNGKVVWSSLNDTINKTSITVADTVLRNGEIYRVRAMFITNTNDKSQMATMTIQVSDVPDVEVLTVLNDMNPVANNTLKIAALSGVNHIYAELVIVTKNTAQTIWSGNAGGVAVTIPANTIKKDTNYILRVKTNVSNKWENLPFRLV